MTASGSGTVSGLGEEILSIFYVKWLQICILLHQCEDLCFVERLSSRLRYFLWNLFFLIFFHFFVVHNIFTEKKCCAYVWSSFMNLLQQQAQMSLCYVPLARDDWKTGQILWTAQMKSTDTISLYYNHGQNIWDKS